MGPNGSENVKTPLLLQIAAKRFKVVLNFPPNDPHKTTLGIFKKIFFFDF